MIRTIKNSNTNRIIGILVNGKRFSLGKDVCHALRLEEEIIAKKEKDLKEQALRIKEEIEERDFFGECISIKLKVRFNSDNTVNSSKTIVDFTEELPQKDKDFVMRILEDFVEALNEAQEERVKVLNSKLEGAYLGSDDVA